MATTSIKKQKIGLILPIFLTAYLCIAFIEPRLYQFLLPTTVFVTLLALAYANRQAAIMHGFSSPFFQLAFVTCTALIISCIYSLQPSHSLLQSLEACLTLLCFSLLWSLPLAGSASLKRNEQLFLGGLYILLLLVSIILSMTSSMDKVSSDLPDGNILHQSDMLAIIFWPLALHLSSRGIRWMAALIFLLNTVAIFIFGCVLSQIIFTLSAFSFGLFWLIIYRHKTATVVLASLVLLTSLIPLIVTLTPMSKSLENSPALNTITPNISELISYWQRNYLLLKQNLPFGSGIDTSQYLSTPYLTSADIKSASYPQNYILELGIDLGLLGLLLAGLAMTAAVTFFYYIKQPVRPFAAATIIASVTFYSLSYGVWYEWRSAFIALAMVLLLKYSRNRYRVNSNGKTRRNYRKMSPSLL